MMCSETSPLRVSFSHDPGQADVVPRRDTTLLDMNSEFEFSIASTSELESCSADELFSNGVILPVKFQETSKQVQKCAAPPTVSLPPLPRPPSNENSRKNFQIVEVNKDLEEKPRQSKSLWGFKRSSSLNHDAKKSLICSLSLLSRSNSTGSVPNKKCSLKDFQNKQGSQKLQASSSNSSSTTHPYQLQQKKKIYGNGGVKISPVLNVPPPYISKGTANLFGLGSFLRSSGSKDKKNKK